MRILFVSNYFPPHYVGGYELHAGQVAQWMAEHGHQMRVLTGDYRKPDDDTPEIDDVDVRRDLTLRYWTDVTDLGYWRRERRDVALFRHHLREFRPDIVVLWNMVKLASGIVMAAQREAPALSYHLMDEWAANFRTANGLPQFWARPATSPWGRLLKPVGRAAYRALLGPDVSEWQTRHATLVSRALQQLLEKNGVFFDDVHVSYITYDHAPFERARKAAATRDGDPTVRFLWAGRLCEGKGLVTTLDALDILHSEKPDGWSVDFCGPIADDDHARIVAPRLAAAPWADRVRYLGSLPHSSMPGQYFAHDAFLFTSEVHEGLPGTIIEAFAAGLPVIGTLTGGTRDVLRPDENCLAYPIGDAAALAGAMARLIDQPDERRRLARDVARFAREHCSTQAVFPRLEAFYQKVIAEETPAE